jgi:hypothetical protein
MMASWEARLVDKGRTVMEGTAASSRDRARWKASRKEPVTVRMKAPMARASMAMPRIVVDVKRFRSTYPS